MWPLDEAIVLYYCVCCNFLPCLSVQWLVTIVNFPCRYSMSLPNELQCLSWIVICGCPSLLTFWGYCDVKARNERNWKTIFTNVSIVNGAEFVEAIFWNMLIFGLHAAIRAFEILFYQSLISVWKRSQMTRQV